MNIILQVPLWLVENKWKWNHIFLRALHKELLFIETFFKEFNNYPYGTGNQHKLSSIFLLVVDISDQYVLPEQRHI